MKCADAQNALWYSEMTEEVRKHLFLCKSCQAENQFLAHFFSTVEETHIPMPNRSFIPSEEELKSSLQFYKKRRFQKWWIGGAAVACLAIVVVQMPSVMKYNSLLGASHTTNHPLPGTLTPQIAATNIAIAPTNDHPDMLMAVRAYLVTNSFFKTTSQVEVLAFKPDVVETESSTAGLVLLKVDGKQVGLRGTFQKINGSWQATNLANEDVSKKTEAHHIVPVLVQASQNAQNDAIRAYLSKIFYDQKDVQKVVFEKFTPDITQTTDSNTVIGTISLTIQLEPGAKTSSYANGPLQKKVKLTKQQQVWSVSELTD